MFYTFSQKNHQNLLRKSEQAVKQDNSENNKLVCYTTNRMCWTFYFIKHYFHSAIVIYRLNDIWVNTYLIKYQIINLITNNTWILNWSYPQTESPTGPELHTASSWVQRKTDFDELCERRIREQMWTLPKPAFYALFCLPPFLTKLLPT